MPADRKTKEYSQNASSYETYPTENTAASGAGNDYNQYYGYDYSNGAYAGQSNADYAYYAQDANASSYYGKNATLNYKNTTLAAAAPSAFTPVSSGMTSTNANGVKTYYPNQSNPNNPVGPVIITKSGYAGPSGSYNKDKKKKKSYVRVAGGEVWEDATLEDWDDQDYRLFAGDLGNEVTEELLYKTFSKYPSMIRTRVVRDSRTMKSKGFGFISFKDPDDFVRAWREMNGKYVGNRPIKLRKSTWKDRNIEVKAKKERERMGPYSKNK
ncbi:hypothetical protein BY458DRAFT_515968 [Sporodiniella umbellata]|nr:hypothetical protein BY458DRAFT_515968 [Sporodiniella umbellata]